VAHATSADLTHANARQSDLQHPRGSALHMCTSPTPPLTLRSCRQCGVLCSSPRRSGPNLTHISPTTGQCTRCHRLTHSHFAIGRQCNRCVRVRAQMEEKENKCTMRREMRSKEAGGGGRGVRQGQMWRRGRRDARAGEGTTEH
jgi:hypothetical protein